MGTFLSAIRGDALRTVVEVVRMMTTMMMAMLMMMMAVVIDSDPG